MIHWETLKSFALSVLILLGLFAQSREALAAGSQTLTVAGGCFWCVEADFESVEGVSFAVSGYTGGTTSNPTYKRIQKGDTGHFEAVQITFDPNRITREVLLEKFLRSIDPTDAGGQFCDRGPTYSTAIFVANDAERALAQAALDNAGKALGQPIVTRLLPLKRFYPAEASHQDYYKGKKIVLTRFGPRTQAKAYKLYRNACGRDQRVRSLWGAAAAF